MIDYNVVDDFGVVLNPMLVEGQVHGGIVQGIGQALLEGAVYDDSGQLLTGSFMDYSMPRADNMPSFDFSTVEVPCKNNAMGVKGCGEAGSVGAPAAVINALVDALARPRRHACRHAGDARKGVAAGPTALRQPERSRSGPSPDGPDRTLHTCLAEELSPKGHGLDLTVVPKRAFALALAQLGPPFSGADFSCAHSYARCAEPSLELAVLLRRQSSGVCRMRSQSQSWRTVAAQPVALLGHGDSRGSRDGWGR